jgi:hypothetical protein
VISCFDGFVVVRGRGTASGAPGELREFFLFEAQGERTTRFLEFLDRDDAIAAAERAG